MIEFKTPEPWTWIAIAAVLGIAGVVIVYIIWFWKPSEGKKVGGAVAAEVTRPIKQAPEVLGKL